MFTLQILRRIGPSNSLDIVLVFFLQCNLRCKLFNRKTLLSHVVPIVDAAFFRPHCNFNLPLLLVSNDVLAT